MNAQSGSAKVWLRPGGLLEGASARQAVQAGAAGWLAGGRVAFSLVELVRRDNGKVLREWRCFTDLRQSTEKAIGDGLALIAAKRADVVGLSMAEPQIMGIVNVTPDSFSDGGAFLQAEKAIAHGTVLFEAGASLLDIGGESTRPGANVVSKEEEAGRVVPVFEGLKELGVPLSVDTRKPEVMKKAAAAGASLINDVTALTFSGESLKTAVDVNQPVCLMHSQGTPETMQDNPQYDDVVLDVYEYLAERVAICVAAGVAKEKIIVDPGIGFGKTLRHNLALIEHIAMFHGLGVPILLGASRKSFIAGVMGDTNLADRLPGSLAVALAGVRSGVQFLRVHDVSETVQAVKIHMASADSTQF